MWRKRLDPSLGLSSSTRLVVRVSFRDSPVDLESFREALVDTFSLLFTKRRDQLT